MDTKLIDIQENDFPLIKEIYDHYILNTTASYHTERITIEELRATILAGHPKYRSFLIDFSGEVCGYCYLSSYKKRQAYDRTAEVSIYLKPEYTGRGIGGRVLGEMERVAHGAGIRVLIGFISGDNEQSIRLFEKCGYEKCAHFRCVGEKFGRILDVVAYQKMLEGQPA